jgi:subtilase family serine protease
MSLNWFAGAALSAALLTAAASASGATAPTPVPATTTVQFTVYLPLQNQTQMKTLIQSQQTKGSANYHKWLTPAQVATQFGPSATTMAQVKSALTAAGLQVTETHMFSFKVTGTAAQVSKLLQTNLGSIRTSTGGTRIVSAGTVTMPAALAAVGAKVPSFAPTQELKVMSSLKGLAPKNINGPAGGYNFDDMKQAYDYPSYQTMLPDGRRLDGTGVNMAFVMESAPLNSDVAAMFEFSNWTALTGKPAPTFTYIPIDGGGSYGGVGDGGTDEASLDVQMELGGAPGAHVSQVSIPDLTDQHILDAYDYVIGDACNLTTGVCVLPSSTPFDIVSSSFGGCEQTYLPAYNNGADFTYVLGIYDTLLSIGSLEGVTWLASSGDEAALLCPSNTYLFGNPNAKFVLGVSNPSDDPNITSVGGGNLITSYTPGSYASTYVSENGFGDPEIPYDPYGLGTNVSGGYWGAGGGLSVIFAQPAYQTFLNTGSSTARTQPDLGMMVGGCPGGIAKLPCGPNRSYVIVTIGGSRYGFIGTSVSSPEFAGALALLVESLSTPNVPGSGRIGIVNYGLYAAGATQIAAGGASAPAGDQFYHMNIPGYDGYYTVTSGQGYNYIYGNGSPDVRNLFGFLHSGYSPSTANPFPSSAPAGIPRTISNP